MKGTAKRSTLHLAETVDVFLVIVGATLLSISLLDCVVYWRFVIGFLFR